MGKKVTETAWKIESSVSGPTLIFQFACVLVLLLEKVGGYL